LASYQIRGVIKVESCVFLDKLMRHFNQASSALGNALHCLHKGLLHRIGIGFHIGVDVYAIDSLYHHFTIGNNVHGKTHNSLVEIVVVGELHLNEIIRFLHHHHGGEWKGEAHTRVVPAEGEN